MPDLREFARTALLEVTPAATIGDFVGDGVVGEEVTNYRFETTMPGYPGWVWSVTIAHLVDQQPTVVESELLPSDGSLLAPDWVPWSERMDDYRAAQAAAAAAGETIEVDGDTDDDDDDDDDFGSDVLHGGDLDGVDIDEADPDAVLSDEDEPDDADSEELESELLDVQVDQGDQAEAEADSGSEDPPRVPRRRKRASKEQEHNQGD